MRRAASLPSFRQRTVAAELERSLEAASNERYRVVHYSLQADHIHLVVEAVDRIALSRGTQGLAIRLARAFNRVVGRRGKVWADRFHERDLRSPREVRAVIVYVLMNHKKHRGTKWAPLTRARSERRLDAFSSAAWFDGFDARADSDVVALRDGLPMAALPVVRPRTWLLRKGWRRGGLIGPDESPVSAHGAGTRR